LGVVQLAEKDAVIVPPGGTVTVRGLEPFTVQFDATFVRAAL